MNQSIKKILTTHVGALPGPVEAWKGELADDQLTKVVGDVVAKQVIAGIDIVNEGEWAKRGGFGDYFESRLSGFERGDPDAIGDAYSQSIRTDWTEFADFYKRASENNTLFEQTGSTAASRPTREQIRSTVCRSAIEYTGQAALQREIDLLRSALKKHGSPAAFLTSTAPACIAVGRTNEFYGSDEEFVFAIAEAMKVEYEAIANAGFSVYIDDPFLAAMWDGPGRQMGLPAYKKYWAMRIEALNHALANVPEEQIGFHVCWGSWHGPHTGDIPLADIVDLLLKIKAQKYLFEAANARHEHEYVLWESVKLPEGKILVPGVVSHATPLVEHPELVSQRIRRFAKIVGAENVIASTDCGLGLRCHPQIAWAKLRSLAEGAALASRELRRAA